ncbi:MAG: hypothetical protein AAF653_07700, partial [Chloroflexota bacterium]
MAEAKASSKKPPQKSPATQENTSLKIAERDIFGEDKVLAYAWELYETYSEGSQSQKTSNSAIRQQIIWLIFLTSTLAVINTLPGMGTVFARANEGMVGIAAYFFSLEIPLFSSFMTNILMFLSGNARQALSVILLILSATTTALLSYASQFTPLRAWIMYRAV